MPFCCTFTRDNGALTLLSVLKISQCSKTLNVTYFMAKHEHYNSVMGRSHVLDAKAVLVVLAHVNIFQNFPYIF